MRKFIYRVTLFIAFAIIFAIAFAAIITSRVKDSFTTDRNVRIVFLGNSHLECGVNDSIVPNSFNFSRSGERMEWVYSKVNLLLDANPQIEKVAIGFDNVLCFKDAKKESVHMGHFSPFFLRTLDFLDLYKILTNASGKYNFDMYTKALNISKLYELIRESGHSAYNLTMGGFIPSDRDKLKEDITRHHQEGCTPNRRFDELSHYFLDKTIQECQSHGVEVIFICAPQHPLIQSEDTTYRNIYRKYYSDIPFFDYRSTVLPDSTFQDLDHLNRIGADIFSRILKEDLNGK